MNKESSEGVVSNSTSGKGSAMLEVVQRTDSCSPARKDGLLPPL